MKKTVANLHQSATMIKKIASFSPKMLTVLMHIYVVVLFSSWFNFFLCFGACMVMYDSEFKTKGNKI